jgi:hypothetical protein
MAPHQERVIAEKVELDEKLAKLMAFFETEVFDGLVADERERLSKQAEYMQLYSDVLGERIAAF